MPGRILLLTAPELTAVALPPLRAANPDIECVVAHTSTELAREFSAPAKPDRIIAFASGVMVPPSTLALAGSGAFGFHPGPPEFRGLFPSAYAIDQCASNFGVTLHRLTADPDSGEIVAVDRFGIPAHADRLALDTLTLTKMIALLTRMAGILTNLNIVPAGCGQVWSGPVRDRTDFAALCRLQPDVTADEFARRYRAVGEGPFHALEIEMFGHRFKLDNRRAEPVVRAGQPTWRAA